MATKEKLSKKRRDHKESKGVHGSGRKVRLTELQKILIVSGGMAHHTRKGQLRVPAGKTKKLQKADPID